jgi:hypothetical protein
MNNEQEDKKSEETPALVAEATPNEETPIVEAPESIEAVETAPVEQPAPESIKPRIPGPPPLADLLDLGIEEEIQREEKERLKGRNRRFPLSPSKFGACSRLLAMELAEFVGMGIFPLELLDPRAKRRFTRGYDIEYSMLKQMKKYVPIQQSFGQQYLTMDYTPDGRYVIGGSLDTMFVSDESMITDIKSKADYWSDSHSNAFEEMFDNIRNMPGVIEFGDKALFIENVDEFYDQYPKDDFTSRYLLQLNAYGACEWARNFRSNSHPDSVGVKAVCLLFENKNNHTMGEIRWAPSQKLYDYSIQRMKDIYQWVVIDKKPPEKYRADFTLGSLACRLCPRKAACWGDSRHPYNGPKKKWATDSNRVENVDLLEKAYLAYKNALTAKTEHDTLETELIREMEHSGETKLRFPDGNVYEIKHLKTPKPHFALRRSK